MTAMILGRFLAEPGVSGGIARWVCWTLAAVLLFTTPAQAGETASEVEILKRGEALYDRDDYATAIPLFQAVVRRNPDHLSANAFLGESLLLDNQPANALPVLEHTIRLAQRDGDELFASLTTMNLASAYSHLGQRMKAEQLLRDAIKNLDRLGQPEQGAFGFNNLGKILLEKGEVAAAIAMFRRVLAFPDKPDIRSDRLEAGNHLGLALMQTGDMDAAERELTKAVTTMREQGGDRNLASGLLGLARISMLRRNFGRARTLLEQARENGRKFPSPEDDAYRLLLLGQVLLSERKIRQSKDATENALRTFEKVGNNNGITEALGMLFAVEVSLGKPERAGKHLSRGIALADRHNLLPRAAQLRLMLGMSKILTGGDRAGGCQLVAESAETFRKMGLATALQRATLIQSKMCG